jgi:hypothetical protein
VEKEKGADGNQQNIRGAFGTSGNAKSSLLGFSGGGRGES